MVQHIPIRFGEGPGKEAERDPDSLASIPGYTRRGLPGRSPLSAVEGPPERPGAPDIGEQPEAPGEAGSAELAGSSVAELRVKLNRAVRQAHGISRDFENYKRHAEKALARAREDAEVELLAELGDSLRSLELAMESADQDADSVRQGVLMVARGLGRIYDSRGLERIQTVGHPFDPALHEAVLVESDPDAEKGTILAELSPGFCTDEKVIRPAKVSVAG